MGVRRKPDRLLGGGGIHGIKDMDRLRLVALGRITRCSGCPRFQALVSANRRRSPCLALPGPPSGCTYQVCAPLAARFSRERERAAIRPRPAALGVVGGA